ncbi:MAG: ChaN family lipoprotein [Oligoflexia bacterium]|nr:ChaN family lipoprotein [Oligoflexia bacterium]
MSKQTLINKKQKSLYSSVKKKIHSFSLENTNEVNKYKKKFLADLPKKQHASNRKVLLQKIKNSKLILVGDFHPFSQSQKTLFRIIRSVSSHKKVCVFLESFSQIGANAYKNYRENKITLNELIETLNEQENWPFDFISYKDLLQLAKEKKIDISNLEPNNQLNTSLIERDISASIKINAEINNYKKIYILVGEYHLAKSHLLKYVNLHKVKKTIIHQNLEQLYWNAPKEKNGLAKEVTRLNHDEFCIYNATPWTKHLSYLEWIEGDEYKNKIDQIDWLEETSQFANQLSDFLKLKIKVSTTTEIVTKLKVHLKTDKALKDYKKYFYNTIYDIQNDIIYISKPSLNSLSEAAAILTWRSNQSQKPKIKKITLNHYFYIFFVGYLGSKIINPKRKVSEVNDITKIIKNSKSKKNKSAALLAKTYFKNYIFNGPIKPETIEAVKMIAQIRAERTFELFLRNKISDQYLIKIFKQSITNEKWVHSLLKEINKTTNQINLPSKFTKF